MKELIEFLEKRKLKEKADNLRNGATTLSLSFSNTGEAGVKELAEVLKSNNSLTGLILGNNNIGDAGAKELAAALKSNNSLTGLNLYSNNIGDGGAKELAEALKSNNSLRGLNLERNNIGEGGAKELAVALKSNNSITYFNLKHNKIGEGGAKFIAEALKSNNSIAGLDIVCDNIGKTGAKELAEALRFNNSITTYSFIPSFNFGEQTYLERNKNFAEKKAEYLNVRGNHLYHQEKYSEAIEKYKIAIRITEASLAESLFSKNNLYLYIRNKRAAEEKQSLKLKQTTSITNENKQEDIKDLPKEVIKQDTTQENLREKLAIFQKIVIETTAKIESNTAISEKDKVVLQDRINEIAKTVKTFLNKADIDTITKSMEELASSKITKARLAVVEEDLSEIIEQQVKLEESIRTEKLAIFHQIVAEMTTKLESNTTINAKDKDIMQNSINAMVSKVQILANETDIETITKSIKELISAKITKARVGVVEEEVDQLIEQQSKPSHDIIINKVEVIYDKPLLNHPELLGAAMEKFSLKEIGERIDELSPCLIDAALNSEEGELIILGGLMSLDNSAAPGS